jgi:predicted RNA-binding Zn-ribbon protein involved in translation (DUF1610 family)
VETWILVWLFCAAIGAAIAHSKNRNWTEGLLLGGLLGVIGVIIELFLRAQAPGLPLPGWYPDPEGTGSQRYWNGSVWSDLPPRSVESRAAPPAVEGLGAVQAQTKKCPDCAETILGAAKVCKHCGYRFAASPSTEPSRPAPQPEPAKPKTTSKVRCHHCQHVQVVPLSESTFPCQQCGRKLKRRPDFF